MQGLDHDQVHVKHGILSRFRPRKPISTLLTLMPTIAKLCMLVPMCCEPLSNHQLSGKLLVSKEKAKKTTFHVEINGGAEQKIEVVTSEYGLAAITSLGMLEYEQADHYQVVKIWIPDLLEDGYGPYFYAWDGFKAGTPEAHRKW